MEGILGVTRNGVEIYDRVNSHLHREGGLTDDILAEAISKTNPRRTKSWVQKFVVEFDHVIGQTTCVEIQEGDEVIMVKRPNRRGKTPMVKGRKPVDCNKVCLCYMKTKDGTMRLITAYIGEGAPREPWDRTIKTNKERIESINFWKTHALIFDEA